MPRLDKTGPKGQGPMTGRRMGRCCTTENNTPINNTNTTDQQEASQSNFVAGRGGFCDGSRKRIRGGGNGGSGFGRAGGFGRGGGRGFGRGNR